jgi:hypothetical protein
VPRVDSTPPDERPGRDQHAARHLSDDAEHLRRERAAESEPGLHRRADDDELGPEVVDHRGDFVSERTFSCADDPAAHADPVRVRDRSCLIERRLQRPDLVVEVRVERELLGHHERSDEDDARAAVGGEPAGEVEGVLGLVPAEQRHDDRPKTLDHSTWYGTLARITPGSNRSSRLT